MILDIKRKRLFYSISSLLIVLLLILGYVLLRNKYKYNNIDAPYDEILSSCMHSKRVLEGEDISCIAFLEEIYSQENSECFDISVLNSGFSLTKHTICEEEGFVTWDESSFGDFEYTYPIYFDSFLKKGFFPKRELESIEISLVEGPALGDIITILNENRIHMPYLYIGESELMKKNGYSVGVDLEISDEKYLKNVNLLSANIYDLSYNNNQFEIHLEVILFEQDYSVQFKIDKIILSSRFGDDVIIIEDESDLEMYKKDILGEVSVFSIFNSINSPLSDSEINEYCMELSEYSTAEFLCTYLKNLKVGTITEEDIDEYIKLQTSAESVSSINLSELLPIYFIEEDDVE